MRASLSGRTSVKPRFLLVYDQEKVLKLGGGGVATANVTALNGVLLQWLVAEKMTYDITPFNFISSLTDWATLKPFAKDLESRRTEIQLFLQSFIRSSFFQSSQTTNFKFAFDFEWSAIRKEGRVRERASGGKYDHAIRVQEKHEMKMWEGSWEECDKEGGNKFVKEMLRKIRSLAIC